VKNRFILSILPVVLALSGCASYMRVTTEVYVGKLPPDELPATASETASIAQNALDGYEARARDAGERSYDKVIRMLVTEYPCPPDHVRSPEFPCFFGDASSVPAFKESFRPVLDQALQPAHNLAEQTRILARQLGAPSASPIATFKDSSNLEQGLLQLKTLLERTGKAGQEGARGVSAAETDFYRQVLRKEFQISGTRTRMVKKKRVKEKFFPNDELLAMKSGIKIDSPEARKSAIDSAIKDIAEAQIAGDAELERVLVSPALDASRVVAATIIVPLNDKAIPMILTAPDDSSSWKKSVNDVVSWNWFGNSEVAFRMDNLGDSHIKGVLFDPSQAMKAGFSVFTKALEITASAYGANFSTPKTSTAGTGTDTTTGSETTTDTANTSTSTTPAPSKPAIDAELARNTAKASTRSEAMELLFRHLTELGKALPTKDDESTPGAAKKLLASVKCTQDELADPTGRQCGGE
jgi:hypothetical protein